MLEDFLTLPAYEHIKTTSQTVGDAELGSQELPRHGDSRRAAVCPRGVGRVSVRPYSPRDVERLRGSVLIAAHAGRPGRARLWELLHATRATCTRWGRSPATRRCRWSGLVSTPSTAAVGRWRPTPTSPARRTPTRACTRPTACPQLVQRINSGAAASRPDRAREGSGGRYWFAPIVADAEAGFGGPLNAFELMKAMIEAGAAGVHFEDQLAAEKKCGHLGGKVLVPTSQFVRTLVAARLAADVIDVPTVLIARTDADGGPAAHLRRRPPRPAVPHRESARRRASYRVKDGLELAIARGLAYAPYADLLWCETSTPDLGEAREFAEAIHASFPGKLLAYNCSPSFNWQRNLDEATIATFQRELGAMGYKFQFVTLAGFHALNHGMFELARGYARERHGGLLPPAAGEFAAEQSGYTADGTSARWAPATSTRSRPSSRVGSLPPWLSRTPRRHTSSENSFRLSHQTHLDARGPGRG